MSARTLLADPAVILLKSDPRAPHALPGVEAGSDSRFGAMALEQTTPRARSAAAAATVEAERPAVIVSEPDRMNLLGLMLSSFIGRRLTEPEAHRHARALRGDVSIEASGMRVTLRFERGLIEISRRAATRPRAESRGTLAALVGAALGRDRVRSLVAGRLKARGDLTTLWHFFALVRV